MNTELSPEITRTCSKGHGKIANNNRFTDLVKLLDMAEITSNSRVYSYQATYYRNISWQTKAWHEPTNCIDQKSLTDHEPKRIRKYDGTHVNIASYNTDSNMARTEL